MNTVPRAVPTVQPSATIPMDAAVYLTLSISGQDYDLAPVADADPSVAVRAWRLAKLPYRLYPDCVYHCREDAQGILLCECSDYLYRGHKRPCKHLVALTRLGFLTAERPRQPAKSPAPLSPYRSAAEAAEHLNPIDVCRDETPF